MKEFIIKNQWLKLCVLNYGARIHRLQYTDSQGTETLVQGLESLEEYLKDETYLGACVGRFAGRICSSTVKIAGEEHSLPTQNGIHLHGGDGFQDKNWNLESIHSGAQPSICLSYLSPAGMSGYPGNLKVFVTYQLIEKSLHIQFEAKTDATTLVNLTQHAYYVLDDSGSFDHYEFCLPSHQYVEMNSNLCPTGNLLNTKGTPYDFTQKKSLGSFHLDTPFVIDNSMPITVFSPKSKMEVEMRTNQNIVVIYTPENKVGFCLETQNYPDSPNHSNFESALLNPEDTYKNECVLTFNRKS